MPNSPSAKKRIRQDVHRTLRNKSRKSMLWTYEKIFHAALDAGNIEEAERGLSKVSAVYDKAVKAGIIHKNRADRKKSRLYAALTAAKQAKSETPASES